LRCSTGVVLGFCYAEIRDFHPGVFGLDHDVGWLYVPMDYTFSVRCAHALEYLVENCQCLVDWHELAFFHISRKGSVEGFAFHELQYQENVGSVGEHRTHLHYVLVIDSGYCSAFIENTGSKVRAVGEFGTDCFYYYGVVYGDFCCPVDDAHSAFPKDAVDSVHSIDDMSYW